MKKFLVSVVLMTMVFFSGISGTYAEKDEIGVYLNGEKITFDVNPQIINGRTMVPIRAIFEAMGAEVNWDAGTRTAICTKDDITVKMTVDSSEMQINDQPQQMDSAPVIRNGRTLAPARYVAESFGATVQWNAKTKNVIICSKDVFAYADYPDIPDVGKCYNTSVTEEKIIDGYKVYSYIYSDLENDDYYGYLFDNSAMVLGQYIEESLEFKDGYLPITYTKKGENEPRFFILVSADENYMYFNVLIPVQDEAKVTLYAADGRTVVVYESEVSDYLNEGWYIAPVTTIYAPDGRTMVVYKNEVQDYLNVGWYESIDDVTQTLYAPDGRKITVYKSEVASYKNMGWYETQYEANRANESSSSSSSSSSNSGSGADGNVYRTPSGKRYHFDPDCGGKNSYRTTLNGAKSAGLTPCSKCAY